VKGTPTASDIGNFTVNMRLYDDRGAENYYSYNVEIKPNSVPTYVRYPNNNFSLIMKTISPYLL